LRRACACTRVRRHVRGACVRACVRAKEGSVRLARSVVQVNAHRCAVPSRRRCVLRRVLGRGEQGTAKDARTHRPWGFFFFFFAFCRVCGAKHGGRAHLGWRGGVENDSDYSRHGCAALTPCARACRFFSPSARKNTAFFRCALQGWTRCCIADGVVWPVCR
jgi:hypothetical protein